MFSNSGAKLVLTQLKTPCLEQHEHKQVNGVVKNMPFSADFVMEGDFNHYEVDFHRFKLKCVLLYDCEEQRQVQCVKAEPIVWTTQVNETGEKATLNMRAMVLSSQHEDMFFRIKFIATPPRFSSYSPLETISGPIRIVSKQQQLKPVGTEATRGRKRPRAGSPIHTTTTTTTNTTTIRTPSSPPLKRGRIEKELDQPADEFVSHLQGMIAAFNSIPYETRHAQLKGALLDAGDSTDTLFHLNTIADTILKCTAGDICKHYDDQLGLMQADPFNESTFNGAEPIPNLDLMTLDGSGAASVPVFSNPDDLFSSWDYDEEKKDNYEAEALPPTLNAFQNPTQSYEPNPVPELSFAQTPLFTGETQAVPNLDLIDPSVTDYHNFFTIAAGY